MGILVPLQRRHVLFTFALFGLSQKVKWLSAQQKLSPRGLNQVD